jgi:hypothetical protein
MMDYLKWYGIDEYWILKYVGDTTVLSSVEDLRMGNRGGTTRAQRSSWQAILLPYCGTSPSAPLHVRCAALTSMTIIMTIMIWYIN